MNENKNPQHKRIDQLLVSLGLARSRHQAQELIDGGKVLIDEKIVKKASEMYPENLSVQSIKILETDLQKYVSRAGVKLARLLESLNLNFENKTVLDVGMSTGGFADCCLQRGAQLVVGIEVGHGQLAERLKADPRIICLENTNIKDVDSELLSSHNLPEQFDRIVVDVSFISLTKVVGVLPRLLKESGQIVALVKPQFEVGPENLNKNGIVKDETQYEKVKRDILSCFIENGFSVEHYILSEVEGSDGNKEFFIVATMAS